MKYLKEKDFILSRISCAIENYCNKHGFITDFALNKRALNAVKINSVRHVAGTVNRVYNPGPAVNFGKRQCFFAYDIIRAYLNGKRISVSSKTSVQNSIVSFGDYSHKSSKYAILQHKAIGWLYPQIAKIRMFGAASNTLRPSAKSVQYSK